MMNTLLIIIRGFSQIAVQNNLFLGTAIILGLTIVSPITLLLTLIGNITGILTGLLVGGDRTAIEIGKFGFNGVLIGSAVSLYIKQLPIAFVVTIVAACLGAIIYYFLLRNHIEPFVIPFALLAWAIVLLSKFLFP